MSSSFPNTGLKGKNNMRIIFIFLCTFAMLSISIIIPHMSPFSYRVDPLDYRTTADVKAQLLRIQGPIKPSNAIQITNHVSSNPPRLTNITNLFDKVDQSVVQVTGSSQTLGSVLGSGFVYDEEGHIITNYHVISGIGQTAEGIGSENGENRFTITFLNGSVYNARVIGTDADSDLAVLKITDDITMTELVPLPIGNSSDIEVGQSVVAIGNPFGLSGSMTEGIISGLGRLLTPQPTLPLPGEENPFIPFQYDIPPTFSIPNIIQTDAAINPGNSGGPLLNTRGEVIGVNTAIFSNTGLYSGVGFAIPSNMVKKVVPSLISTGSYDHPYLGIAGTDLTSDISERIGLPTNNTGGFLITQVTEASPADQAGLRGGDVSTNVNGREVELGGDVITGVDNVTVRKIDDLISYLEREKSVGDTVNLTIFRDSKKQQIDVTLAARPSEGREAQLQQQRQQQTGRPSLGITGINITPEIAQSMSLTQIRNGFLVIDVASGGPADDADIRGGYRVAQFNGTQIELGGDVIIGIDNVNVRSIEDIQSYLNTKDVGDLVELTIIKDDQQMRIPVTLGPPSTLADDSDENNNNNRIPELEPSPQPQPPPDPFNNFFNDMYERCIETVGRNVCDPLFGR
ncbi:MAG: trypsin-like peptidase domain-containing protein [Nitrososphaeraceae archaeon]